MNFMPTTLPGVFVVETTVVRDPRGEFARLYCEHELAPILGGRKIVQINRSASSNAGAIRGLHFQRKPALEVKFVRCLQGRVWDVALDLRAGSPTFLQWHAEELSAENARMLVVPEGCAHGFQTLTESCELLYLHTACYAPETEGGVAWNDPRIDIQWPLPVSVLSERDRNHAPIAPDFPGISV